MRTQPPRPATLEHCHPGRLTARLPRPRRADNRQGSLINVIYAEIFPKNNIAASQLVINSSKVVIVERAVPLGRRTRQLPPDSPWISTSNNRNNNNTTRPVAQRRPTMASRTI